MTYNVFGGTLNPTQSINLDILNHLGVDHECDGRTDRQNRLYSNC